MISYNSKGRSIVAARKIIFHRNSPGRPPLVSFRHRHHHPQSVYLRERSDTHCSCCYCCYYYCRCIGNTVVQICVCVCIYSCVDVFNPAEREREEEFWKLFDRRPRTNLLPSICHTRTVVLSVRFTLIIENPEHLCSITQPIIQ